MKVKKSVFFVMVFVNVLFVGFLYGANFKTIEAKEVDANLSQEDVVSYNEEDFEFVDNIEHVSKYEVAFASRDSQPIGFVEFEDGRKVPLSTKSDHKTLLTSAGFMNPGILLDEENPTNTAIAGHNMKDGRLFGVLHDVELGEIITLNTSEKTYKYEVYDIVVVEDTEVEMIEDPAAGNDSILSLMTCTQRGQKRLFVIGRLVF